MRDLLKPAAILFAICAVVTAVLAFVVLGTRPTIVQHEEESLVAARKAVLSEADSFKPLADAAKIKELSQASDATKTVLDVQVGAKAGQYCGMVATIRSRGYDASGVNFLVGISADGTIQRVAVLGASETPGLGTNVLSDKYLQRYVNRKPDAELKLVTRSPNGVNEVDAITGATVTSRAVWRGVEGSMEFYRLLDAQGGLK